jgi:hypothetical protein
MSTTIDQGQEQPGGFIGAPCAITWADLSSTSNGYGAWSAWQDWNPEPGTISVTVLEDAGSIDTRLPLLSFGSQGTATVTLKIADTMDSNGLVSPTTYNLAFDTGQSIVAGRYYEYTITVTADSTVINPIMSIPQLDFQTVRNTEYYESIDTSTLSGTIEAREIETTVPTVTSIVATARQEGVTYSSGLLQDRVYAIPDDYVFQENAIVVNIVSLSPPKIRCFDLNGESIDAIVDIIVRGSPQIVLTPNGVEEL